MINTFIRKNTQKIYEGKTEKKLFVISSIKIPFYAAQWHKFQTKFCCLVQVGDLSQTTNRMFLQWIPVSQQTT